LINEIMLNYVPLLLCTTAGALLAAPAQDPAVLLIRDATVVHARSTPVAPHRDVLIRGNRIADVRPTGSGKIPNGAKVVDAGGKFLIPGLWDMHTHTLAADRVPTWLALFVANGVTGVRDMGSSLSLEQIQEIKTGKLTPKPRIYAAGKILGGPYAELSIIPSSPADGRRAVRELKQGGADFIKVYTLLPQDVFFAVADEARKQGMAVVGHVPLTVPLATAAAAGFKTFEHGYGLLESCSTREEAVRARIEKAPVGKLNRAEAWGAIVQATDQGFAEQDADGTWSETKCAQLSARLKAFGVWQCPTLVVRRTMALLNDPTFTADSRLRYIARPLRTRWQSTLAMDERSRGVDHRGFAARRIRLAKESEMAANLAHQGVRLLAGSDCGNPFILPGFSLHDELELLVNAGLSPLEALTSATLNPARFLGREGDFGTVERGKIADLVLLDNSPMKDIRNTRKVRAVVLNGEFLAQDQLNRIFADVETAAR
jgi:imidazolonepropionase-like amidohydrolase